MPFYVYSHHVQEKWTDQELKETVFAEAGICIKKKNNTKFK